MLTSAWFALALAQAQQGTPSEAPQLSPQQAAVVYPFAPVTVIDSVRLALTPVLDGKLDVEEWDPLTSDGRTATFFQWDFDRLYVAASGPSDTDLVVSLDLKGDGWLVGKDNLEIKVAAGSKALTARLLDCTNPQGPTWIAIPGFGLSSRVAQQSSGTVGFTEVAIVDPGLDLIPTVGSKLGGRVDLVPVGSPEPEAFRPRSLPSLTLGRSRAAALPSALRWNVEREDVPLVPGDRGFIRLTFNGTDALGLRRIDLRTEGFARETTSIFGVAFPSFDRKGRAFVDYSPSLARSSSVGFRLVRGTVTTADGIPGIIQVSFRSAPLVDVDVIRERFPSSDQERTLKLAVYVDSNTVERVEGEIGLSLPLPFRILNGTEKQKMIIGEARSRIRRAFDVYVPANTTGTFPLEFTITSKGREVKQTGYLVIGG